MAMTVGTAPASGPVRPTALMDAAALGLPALASMLVRTEDGIAVVGADKLYVYANPAACLMLGHPIEQLRGRPFLGGFPAREHATILAHLPEHLGGVGARFTSVMLGADGAEREIVCSIFAIDVAGSPHGVAIFQDLTAPRAAARTAAALSQTTAQLVGTGSTDDILTGIARHAVEGTRALACGISVMSDEHKLVARGGFATGGELHEGAFPPWTALTDAPVEDVIAAMTGGSIVLGEVPNKPFVLPDARSAWEGRTCMRGFAANLSALDWQAAVCVPVSWKDRVFGLFSVFLPSGLSGPSEAELAFYTALADQVAIAVTNARLASQAGQLAALLERARLARELHDSVSQALFSMTMHARAAQLSLVEAGLDGAGPLGRSIAQLGELTRGALAEMRALIFELRPEALAEEGLVGALRKQGAALSAREQVTVTVDGPEHRLELGPGVEEHLYRIASEALHNVVKHASAENAVVSVAAAEGALWVTVTDDGSGFDPGADHAGHLGLSTMAERAKMIGADLTVASAPGVGTKVSLSLPAKASLPEGSGPGAG